MSLKFYGGIDVQNQSKIRLFDLTSAHSVSLQPVSSLAGDITFTLPSTAGSANQLLSTDGSGVLSFTLIADANVSGSAAIAYSKLALTGSIVNADINASAAIAYSKLNLSGSIVNADINASAAIVYSKLSLSNSIVNADINAAAAIAYSKLNLTASIVNADIAAGAAIAYSKLAALTANRALQSDGSGFVSVSTVTSTELGYVSGVTSAIQTQLNGKASTALDNLTVSGLAADDLLYASSSSALTRLPIGTNGQVLTVVSGAPAWAASGSESSFKANWTQVNATVTISNASPGVITYTAHGLVTGQAIYFTTSGTLPSPLQPNVIYYVHTVNNANSFTIAATRGGSDINTTTAGSGTHTINTASINVVHNLGSLDITIELYDKTDGSTIRVDEELRTDTNNLLLNASTQASSAGWRVLITTV